MLAALASGCPHAASSDPSVSGLVRSRICRRLPGAVRIAAAEDVCCLTPGQRVCCQQPRAEPLPLPAPPAEDVGRGADVDRPGIFRDAGVPQPVPEFIVGETGPGEHVVTGQAVRAADVALARLLQRLGQPNGPDFDTYLHQTGAVELPDEDLD